MATVDEAKIGKKIAEMSFERQQEGKNLLDQMDLELKKLNKSTTGKVRSIYTKHFDKIKTGEGNEALPTEENLGILPRLLGDIRKVQQAYRAKYGKIFRTYRRLSFLSMAEREKEAQNQKCGRVLCIRPADKELSPRLSSPRRGQVSTCLPEDAGNKNTPRLLRFRRFSTATFPSLLPG